MNPAHPRDEVPRTEPRRPTLPAPRRMSFLQVLLIAKVVLSLLSLAITVHLAGMAASRTPIWELEYGRGNAMETWSLVLSIALTLGIPVSAGLLLELLRWLHMVHGNLQSLGGSSRFHPRWVVLGALVPVINLVLPYQVAQEVWGQSSAKGRKARSLPLLLAWAAWIVAGILGATLVAARAAMNVSDLPRLFQAQQLLIALASGLCLSVVADIEQRQRLRWLDFSTEPPTPPSQHLGPYHGILVAVLGLAGVLLTGWVAVLAGWERGLVFVIGAQAALLLASIVIFERPDWHWPREPAVWSRTWTLVGSALIGGGLSLTWSSLIVHRFPSALRDASAHPRVGVLEGLALLAILVVVAPVVEELVFRGAILQSLRTEWNRGPAILLSSLLFACLHLHPITMMAALCLGCLCATVRLATNWLAPAMLMHGTYNLGVTILLHGEQPGPFVTSDLAWRGGIWVGLGLVVASHRRGSIGSSRSRAVQGVARTAGLVATVLAALALWNGGTPEWSLLSVIDTHCWLALAIGVSRQSRGAAILLLLFHLATGSVSTVDILAAILFLATVGLLVIIRSPHEEAVASGVADPRWWWGAWSQSLVRTGAQLPRMTASDLDQGVGTYVGRVQRGVRAVSAQVDRSGRQGVETVRRDLDTGVLAEHSFKILLGINLVTFLWSFAVSARLYQQRMTYVPNRAMRQLAEHLQRVDVITLASALLLFVALVFWLGRTRVRLGALGLLEDGLGRIWRVRGMVAPLAFFTRPWTTLTEVWTGSQHDPIHFRPPAKPANLRALAGTFLLLLTLSLPVQLVVGGAGLNGWAQFAQSLRQSPLGMGLWILLLVRLFFFARTVDQGIVALGKPAPGTRGEIART